MFGEYALSRSLAEGTRPILEHINEVCVQRTNAQKRIGWAAYKISSKDRIKGRVLRPRDHAITA